MIIQKYLQTLKNNKSPKGVKSKLKLVNIIKIIYYRFLSKYIDGKIKIFNRHSSYEDYVKKQLEKTLDLKRISIWKGAAWQIKVDGFENLFKRNEEYIYDKKKSTMFRIKNRSRSVCVEKVRYRCNRSRSSRISAIYN